MVKDHKHDIEIENKKAESLLTTIKNDTIQYKKEKTSGQRFFYIR